MKILSPVSSTVEQLRDVQKVGGSIPSLGMNNLEFSGQYMRKAVNLLVAKLKHYGRPFGVQFPTDPLRPRGGMHTR